MSGENRNEQRAEQFIVMEISIGRGTGPLAINAGKWIPSSREREEITNMHDYTLLEQILDKANLNRAYKQVKRNKGSAGVDNMPIEELRYLGLEVFLYLKTKSGNYPALGYICYFDQSR